MPDYRVVRNGVLLGTLTRTGSDMPWWEGEFDPAPGFESLRPIFDRERELLEADEDMSAWGRAYEELAAGLVLEPLDAASRSRSSCSTSTGGRHPGDTEARA